MHHLPKRPTPTSRDAILPTSLHCRSRSPSSRCRSACSVAILATRPEWSTTVSESHSTIFLYLSLSVSDNRSLSQSTFCRKNNNNNNNKGGKSREGEKKHQNPFKPLSPNVKTYVNDVSKIEEGRRNNVRRRKKREEGTLVVP